MTLLYKIYPAHIYIAVCVFFWGLSASLQSVVTNLGGLITLRACLGIAEAAFGPGLPFYLSFFYKRDELALRTGLFISAAPLATSIAGSLAWAITSVTTWAQITLAPWRALFLSEGFPSVIVAIFVWKYVPDRPGQAHYLTPRERKIAVLRMRKEKKAGEAVARKSRQDTSPETRGMLDWREVLRTLQDSKAWLTASMFFACNVAFSSLPVFLPTILRDMGYASTTSQALSAPPYLVAFFVVILTAYYSDRARVRSTFHSSLPESLTITLRYAAIYPVAAGFFSSITLIITWSMDNQPRATNKGASIALMNIIGQCGPLLGTRLYPESQGPWYVSGMSVCAVCMLIVAILAFILRIKLQKENERSVKDNDTEIEMVTGEASGLMSPTLRGTPEEEIVERFVNIL
ncbi:pre-mRNA-splicing factor rse1 [Ascosphaera pollenicola]|nr:pre-mRNA-splicing factor rse1 [Ascosphaera pollenicola]